VTGPLAVLAIQLAAVTGSPPVSSTSYSSATLAAVEIERREIFDPDEARWWFPRLVNWLHVRTREGVVRRDVLLAPGLPYDSALAAESIRNLRALGTFRRVQLDTVRTDSGLVARVVTKDAWSTQLDFGFRSAGHRALYSIEVREQNLLGTQTMLEFQTRHDADYDTHLLHFAGPRLFVNRMGLNLEYRRRSDGYSDLMSVSAPFVTQSTPSEFAVVFAQARDTLRRYRGGISTPVERAGRTLDQANAQFMWAVHRGSRGFLRMGLEASALHLEIADASGRMGTTSRVMGQGGIRVDVARARFLVLPGYRRLTRDDDIDLSSAVTAELSYAPRLLGYPRDGVAPSLEARTGALLPGGGGFIQAIAAAGGFYSGTQVDSGVVTVGLTAGIRAASRHLVVLHGEHGWRRHPPLGDDFDLGLDRGPRGYGAHAFTGDRQIFGTVEWRWAPVPELARLIGIGLATFADFGGAWFAGEELRTGASFGVGLRLDFTRSGDPSVVRIDVAHRSRTDTDRGGWAIVVGKGFVFSPER
jgi:hypothetical protein